MIRRPGLSVGSFVVAVAVMAAALATPFRAAAQNSAEQADEMYRQGIAALQQGDLASAKADFQNRAAPKRTIRSAGSCSRRMRSIPRLNNSAQRSIFVPTFSRPT
jgi:hypothetical protein